MTHSFHHPRRPVMLDPQVAENIEGGVDPAQSSQLAHSTALMVCRAERRDKKVQQLMKAIDDQGIDIVSELWSDSPATTLPGMLWRLYLVYQWFVRDPRIVEQRFKQGCEAPVIVGLPDKMQGQKVAKKVHLASYYDKLFALFHMHSSIDMAPLWLETAIILRIMASGATFGSTWVEDDNDVLATEVTRRARALLRTAEECEEAAQLMRHHRLH